MRRKTQDYDFITMMIMHAEGGRIARPRQRRGVHIVTDVPSRRGRTARAAVTVAVTTALTVASAMYGARHTSHKRNP